MDMLLAPIIIGAAMVVVFCVGVYRASKFSYRCTRCKTTFDVNPVSGALAPQSQGKKYLVCPTCRTKKLCNLIFKG